MASSIVPRGDRLKKLKVNELVPKMCSKRNIDHFTNSNFDKSHLNCSKLDLNRKGTSRLDGNTRSPNYMFFYNLDWRIFVLMQDNSHNLQECVFDLAFLRLRKKNEHISESFARGQFMCKII